MDKQTKKIMNRYNRVSYIYDIFESPMELMAMKKYRQEIMNDLRGKVLEVGVGTGRNIEFYPKDLDITAIDFSDHMLKKAKEKTRKLNKNVDLQLADVQQLPFDDHTFDTVFTTCVFCSVPDPILGLKEIRRVLKPEGKVILLEHVKSKKKILGFLMEIFNPIIVNLYGANINRDTEENVLKAGYLDITVKNLVGDIVLKIIAN